MKIDHIALQVNDIAESVNYYKEYGSKVLYQDCLLYTSDAADE